MNTGKPTLLEQIFNGFKSYNDHCELCSLEELPGWVNDIRHVLHTGRIKDLVEKDYEPWVAGAYCLVKAQGIKTSKSDGIK